MRRREKKRTGFTVRTLLARLAAVIAVLLAVRALSEGFDAPLSLPRELGAAVLAMELPGMGPDLPEAGAAALLSALPNTGEDTRPPATEPSQADTQPTADTSPVSPSEPPSPTENTGPAGTSPSAPDAGPTAPDTPENPAIGTTITGKGGDYTDLGEGIYIKNRTDYSINLKELLDKPLSFSVKSSAVLIVHTHGSEAYNPAGQDKYVPSDPSRTEDKNFNVVRLGDELEKILTSRGITVYHDRELHDYPSYAGSYERTLTAINAQLKAHPEICVVIDLHRDALEGDGKLYKTVAQVGDRPSAQVMLICGTNFSGLKHPGWRDNLSFAMKLQKAMVTKYPTLARPLKISEYRYNQHATPGSLILEVGTNGNTLQEALTALTYFGDCMAGVLTD